MVLERIKRRLRWLGNRAAASKKWFYYSIGHPRPPIYPDRLYIESTNHCNLACVMCPTGLGTAKREKGYMDLDLFRQIVDEMAPHVKATTLHIWGEPLLHPRIVDMIAYCHHKGLHSEISTNAVLLDESISKAILQAGLGTIYLCMDGTTKETYEQIRRRANFEETKANILRFLELKEQVSGPVPETKLQIIEIAPTADEISQFKDEWRLPGVDRINVKGFDSWGGQVEEINELGHAKPNVPSTRFACPNLWYHAHIYWDGSLVRCDRDFDAVGALGNVSQGVMRAWRGPQMAELRRKHVRQELDDEIPCNNCTEWAWWKPTLLTSQGNRSVEY